MSDTRPASGVGVLLMAYGGPGGLDDVAPYLADVTGGRPLPAARIEEIRERYRLIGGKSPILDLSKAQAGALAERLSADGYPAPVFVGMRHWHPFIRETVREMMAYPLRRVIAVCLAPQYSSMSVGAYQKRLEEAVGEHGASWDIAFVEGYHDHPRLLEAFAEKVGAVLDTYSPAERAAVQVIFTAHSLPQRILQAGDPYDHQVRETAQGVRARVGPLNGHFAYQSQGRTPEPWLGPTVESVLDDLQRAGHRHVLVVPVGFIADHVEVLYDVDILFRERARALGMRLDRTESLNTSPRLIEALADVVRTRWDR